MNKQAFLHDLAALLEVDVTELTDQYHLANNSLWDSLSVVSTVASIDQYYHVAIKGIEIEPCKTLRDLFELIHKRQQQENNVIQFSN